LTAVRRWHQADRAGGAFHGAILTDSKGLLARIFRFRSSLKIGMVLT